MRAERGSDIDAACGQLRQRATGELAAPLRPCASPSPRCSHSRRGTSQPAHAGSGRRSEVGLLDLPVSADQSRLDGAGVLGVEREADLLDLAIADHLRSDEHHLGVLAPVAQRGERVAVSLQPVAFRSSSGAPDVPDL